VKILIASSEVAPFAKTGGLADVAGSLPLALLALGHDVRIILPCYRTVKERFSLLDEGITLDVPFDGSSVRGRLFGASIGAVPVTLVDAPLYFERDGLYGYASGDYEDNALRFGFFSRAIPEALRALGWVPDIIHLNDWQTSLAAVYLKTVLRNDPLFAATGTFLSIHNLGYQGLFPSEVLPRLGLPSSLGRPECLEYHGKLSFLKGGVVCSDAVGTVSETYLSEILTPEEGFGFDGILKQRDGDLYGILNGIDDNLWNPGNDAALSRTYSATEAGGKKICRNELQCELGLDTSFAGPIVAMVTRLDPQKGIDLVAKGWEAFLERPLQFVLLGTGTDEYNSRFSYMKDVAPGRVSINLKFDDSLAHRIYAASDLFLMPSRYEPCGLGQLIALRYGSLPIVRRTGGLADTVIDVAENPDRGNGFVFEEYDVPPLLAALDRAIGAFGRKESWSRFVRNAMETDFSWNRSARRYGEVYSTILEKKRRER